MSVRSLKGLCIPAGFERVRSVPARRGEGGPPPMPKVASAACTRCSLSAASAACPRPSSALPVCSGALCPPPASHCKCAETQGRSNGIGWHSLRLDICWGAQRLPSWAPLLKHVCLSKREKRKDALAVEPGEASPLSPEPSWLSSSAALISRNRSPLSDEPPVLERRIPLPWRPYESWPHAEPSGSRRVMPQPSRVLTGLTSTRLTL